MKLKKRHILTGVTILILIAIICIVAMWVQNRGKGETETLKYKHNLGNGGLISDISSRTGEFWEDGTGRKVENVWKITVWNTSDEDIQYLKIIAREGENSAQFELTTLPAGEKAEVLESSAKELPEWEKDCTYKIETQADFTKEMSLHTDLFTVSAKANHIKLENKSTQNFDNDIYVYFKQIDEEGIFGGITYRITFSGGLKAGETKEEQSQHYDPDTCRIVYLTYE